VGGCAADRRKKGEAEGGEQKRAADRRGKEVIRDTQKTRQEGKSLGGKEKKKNQREKRGNSHNMGEGGVRGEKF